MEDIAKRREPLPLAAVYFISPSPSSVAHLVADFESKPLYPSVHVFFSSGVTQDVVDRIKRCRVSGSSGHGVTLAAAAAGAAATSVFSPAVSLGQQEFLKRAASCLQIMVVFAATASRHTHGFHALHMP